MTSWVEVKASDVVGRKVRAASCKFPTEDIMGAHNFNFAHKSPPPIGEFRHQILYFERKFSDRLKFRVAVNAPCHNVPGKNRLLTSHQCRQTLAVK